MRAKKSLGQNFLTSKSVLQNIIRVAHVTNEDTILEIGPGKGALTTELLKGAKHIITIEKDENLVACLSRKFEKEISNGRLMLISDDVFNMTQNEKIMNALSNKFKIVANIPYNITGALLPFFFSLPTLPRQIVIMVQYEVAKRIRATDKKESILSLSVKAYSDVRLIQKVSRKYFKPQPKVDSAVLSLENISKDNFKKTSEKDFFNLIKKGFSQKRKLLKNNLGVAEEILEDCGISPKTRAENLTLQQWLCLLN
tara:strand:- start:3046 stop:3810 length:765 start_codon:yes stop_codon:yes gene_type:complete